MQLLPFGMGIRIRPFPPPPLVRGNGDGGANGRWEKGGGEFLSTSAGRKEGKKEGVGKACRPPQRRWEEPMEEEELW